MGMVWEWYRNGIGMVWEWYGNGMGMVWEWYGNGMDGTNKVSRLARKLEVEGMV